MLAFVFLIVRFVIVHLLISGKVIDDRSGGIEDKKVKAEAFLAEN